MVVIGKGTAHGACSLLHAAALGYGAAIALDLPVTVRLLDRPSKRNVIDDDGVLDEIMNAWLNAGYPLPEGHQRADLHWGVNSKIPKKQGLKSSAATCVAALRALMQATETNLQPTEIVRLSAEAQLAAGVSITGSIDDAWACMTTGWKLVDVQAPIEDGVLIEDSGFPKKIGSCCWSFEGSVNTSLPWRTSHLTSPPFSSRFKRCRKGTLWSLSHGTGVARSAHCVTSKAER